MVALALVLGSGTVIWRFSRLPIQPAHVTMARVDAIVPEESRWYANRDRIYLRAEHAVGWFELLYSDDRCRVGEQVLVQQRGVTLRPLPTTCRS